LFSIDQSQYAYGKNALRYSENKAYSIFDAIYKVAQKSKNFLGQKQL